MIIKVEQIATLGTPAKEKFILKTIEFLRENTPEWAEEKDGQEIRGPIEEMIKIGKELNIKKEVNIQKLLYYSKTKELQIPFSAAIQEILKTPDLGEDLRTKNLIKAIVKNHVR